jgi:hypothetical protein
MKRGFRRVACTLSRGDPSLGNASTADFHTSCRTVSNRIARSNPTASLVENVFLLFITALPWQDRRTPSVRRTWPRNIRSANPTGAEQTLASIRIPRVWSPTTSRSAFNVPSLTKVPTPHGQVLATLAISVLTI